MAGFGILRGSIAVGDISISIEKHGNVTKYVRRGAEVVERDIVGSQRILVTPMYPVFTPDRITEYILITFDKPLLVAPGESITIYTMMPVEIAVYTYGWSGGFSVIDVFSVRKPKYALYGPVDHGVIARYYRSRYWFSERSPDVGEALVRIVVRNRCRDWIDVTRILLDCNPLKLYYEEGTWRAYTQEITLNIVTPSSASISYNKPFKEHVIPIDDPPGLKQPMMYNRTEMLWGI